MERCRKCRGRHFLTPPLDTSVLPAMERIKETTEKRSTTKKKSEKQRSETAVENVDKRVSGPAKQETSKDEAITIGDRIQHSEKEGNGEKEIEPEAEGKVEEHRTEEKERRRR